MFDGVYRQLCGCQGTVCAFQASVRWLLRGSEAVVVCC